MSLLPREATFAEEVADYFLAFKGSGLALSALDAELLMGWHRRGLPLAVVCRGIRRTAEARLRSARPGEGALASLRSCSRAGEDEFRRYQGLSAGSAAPRPAAEAATDRLAKARSALRRALKLAGGPARLAIEKVLPLAQGRPQTPGEAAALVNRLDEALALGYLRALPLPERRALWARAKDELGSALARRSPRARKATLRAYRVLHARAHGALPVLK